MSAVADGYNPLRWDCTIRGCFNEKKRPKIEQFASALPGRIAFGDVDGIVEIQGNALLLEWKETPQKLQTGQRLMYTRLSQSGQFAVLVCAGDAATMDITHTAMFLWGKFVPWQATTFVQVHAWIHSWSLWAQTHPFRIEDAAKHIKKPWM